MAKYKEVITIDAFNIKCVRILESFSGIYVFTYIKQTMGLVHE